MPPAVTGPLSHLGGAPLRHNFCCPQAVPQGHCLVGGGPTRAPPAAGRRLWSDSRLAQTTKPWWAEGAGLSPGQGPPCSNQSSQQVKPQEGATTEPGNPCAHTPYCTLRISLWEPQEGKPLGQDSRTPDPFWPQGSGVSHGPDANTWSRQGCKSKPPPPNQRHRPDPGTVNQRPDLQFVSGKHGSVQRRQSGTASAHRRQPWKHDRHSKKAESLGCRRLRHLGVKDILPNLWEPELSREHVEWEFPQSLGVPGVSEEPPPGGARVAVGGAGPRNFREISLKLVLLARERDKTGAHA